MRIVRPVVRTVGTLSHAVRDVSRLQEVTRVLVRHGLGLLVQGRGRTDALETTPERARDAIVELGPTFIKLGQVLSTRPDILPQAYLEAFAQLQDDVTALPYGLVRAVLEKDLGRGWASAVRAVDESPLATASIAQVHRAILTDGRQVVLKVQRPDIARQIRSDLSILHFLVGRLLQEFPEAAYFDPAGTLAEFERSLLAEIDFTLEARNVKTFYRNFADDPWIRVPAVVDELSGQRVLCLEWIDGVKIRLAREAGFDMRVVGERYLHAAYTMLFEHGTFHADLHPGNVLVLEGGVLALLDFGMVGQLSREITDQIVALIFALEHQDFRAIARIVYDIGIKEDRVDYAAFERDVLEIVQRHFVGISMQDLQIGSYLNELTRGAVRHRVRIPTTFTMFFKALLTTEGLAKSLIPEVDPIAAAQPWVRSLVAERFSGARLQEDLFYNLVTASSLLRRLPVTVTQLLDDIERQRLQVQVVSVESREQSDAADRRQRRVVYAVLSAGLAVAGSIALLAPVPTLFWVPWPAAVLYGLAGAGLAVTLLRSRTRS